MAITSLRKVCHRCGARFTVVACKEHSTPMLCGVCANPGASKPYAVLINPDPEGAVKQLWLGDKTNIAE